MPVRSFRPGTEGTETDAPGRSTLVRVLCAPGAPRPRALAPLLGLGGPRGGTAPLRVDFRREGIELDVGPVPAGHLVLATLALARDGARAPWTVRTSAAAAPSSGGAPDDQAHLAPIGAHVPAPEPPGGRSGPRLRAHEDWFETLAPCARLTLALCVEATGDDWRRQPHLLCVSVRPRPGPSAPPEPLGGRARAPTPVRAGLSQRTFGPRLGPRICAPVSLAMLGEGLQELTGPAPNLLARAHHRGTDLFGVWPQNVWAACAPNRLAGALALVDGADAGAWLRAAGPLAISAAWGPGELPDAAQRTSSGHFMVLEAIDGARCRVLDPAAPDADTVRRRYDSRALTSAWLGHHGVAYFRVRL